MIFANMFYKTHRTPLSKLRQHQSQQLPVTLTSNPPDWSVDEHADLLSRDKAKVKEAVRRYLSGRVRNDWVFNWPPIHTKEPQPAGGIQQQLETTAPREPASIQDEPNDDDGYQVDEEPDSAEEVNMDGDDDDAQSVYSVMSADPARYKTRTEWDSDAPVNEPNPSPTPGAHEQQEVDLQVAQVERGAQKRREIRKEMEWNEGLACFEARRNAWTQARTVRLRVKPETPQSPSSQRSSRRFFFRHSISSASSQGTNSQSGTSTVPSEGSPPKDTEKESGKHLDKASTSSASAGTPVSFYPVETIVPVPPPILPPNNPLRASITTGNYLQLYDKLIVNSMQPSCPVNLSDMIGACVAGWKRDGEWPPRPSLPVDSSFNPSGISHRKKRASIADTNDNSAHPGRRLSLTGFLSRDKDTESRTGKGVRQSLQKAFGLASPIPPHLDTPVTAERRPHR